MTVTVPRMRDSCWGEGKAGDQGALELAPDFWPDRRQAGPPSVCHGPHSLHCGSFTVRNGITYSLSSLDKIQVIFAILLLTKEVFP